DGLAVDAHDAVVPARDAFEDDRDEPPEGDADRHGPQQRETEDLSRRVDDVERRRRLVTAHHRQDAGGDDAEDDTDPHENAVARYAPHGRFDGLAGIGGGHASILPWPPLLRRAVQI